MQAAALLPEYMVPATWVHIERLPATGNGKLDRNALQALPLPQQTVPEPQAPPVARPSAAATAIATVTEERIAAVWCEVLGLTSVAHDVRILDLGADSLHIFRIAARLHAKGLPVRARDLLANPTIVQQAKLADRALAEQLTELTHPDGRSSDAPSLANFRLGAMRNRQSVS